MQQPPSARADLLAGASRVRNMHNQWAGTFAYGEDSKYLIALRELRKNLPTLNFEKCFKNNNMDVFYPWYARYTTLLR
jgi:hypothetical protein